MPFVTTSASPPPCATTPARLPRPRQSRTDANQRLMSTLQTERTAHPSGSPSPSTGRVLGGGGLPRFAMAAAVVLVAFVAFAALDRDNGPTVEAATIEGVVLGNTEGNLTVQTLDALEQVSVPSDAAVSDAAGASIELARIAPGEVVVIQAQRRGDSVVARQVARLVANIETWCNDASDRCEVLTDRLRDLEEGCEEPAARLPRYPAGDQPTTHARRRDCPPRRAEGPLSHRRRPRL